LAAFVSPSVQTIAFHAFADTAFVGGTVTQKVLEKYGISLLFSKPNGTVERYAIRYLSHEVFLGI
jgi:hypothetical protein